MTRKLIFFSILIAIFFIGCSLKEKKNIAFKTTSDFQNNKLINTSEPCIDPIFGMKFVWIPAGCIEIGLSDEEQFYLSENKVAFENLFRYQLPRHQVCVDGFWMSKYEVTIGQFKKFVQYSNYSTDAEKLGWVYDFTILGVEKGLNWKNAGFV